MNPNKEKIPVEIHLPWSTPIGIEWSVYIAVGAGLLIPVAFIIWDIYRNLAAR